MSATNLNVKVIATIDWLNPPEGHAEARLREQVNIMAQAAADKLTDAVSLLVALQMDTQRETASLFTTNGLRKEGT